MKKVNTILNLMGLWLPWVTLLLCGAYAYLQLAIKLFKAIINEYFN
jgi:hypothetical protein